ncbi:MAG: hypothetical protein DMF64_20920 [Acidobacteria bacterium]|nr:MAG: hypothetical protein DMF64_20920 [Acidobacteriota bacterium]
MGNSGRVYQEDTFTSRLVTYPLLDQEPAALRVSWIHWDSSFRGSRLTIGDQIIGVNGVPIVKPEQVEDVQRMLPMLVGQYAESQFWAQQGAKEGEPLTLTVRRRKLPGQGWETLETRGELRAERRYLNEQERWVLGPGGPDNYAHDGFPEAWSSWYEKLVAQLTRILAEGWAPSFSSRYELECHLEYQARIEYLAEHYPGPLADALKADWEAARTSLVGRKYEIAPEALAYRRAEEERVQQVADAARQSWAAFLQAKAAEIIEPFPGIDPIHGDLASIVGKYVVLPPIGYRDWVSEAEHNWLTSSQDRTYYFADTETPAAERMLLATRRYRKLVTPNIREDYAIVGRVLPEPRLLIIQERGIFGTQVEPVAALVGDAMFIDLTTEQDGVSPFAGEQALMKPSAALPPDDATPKQVMEAWIAALKEGDLALWKELFADWYVDQLPDGRPFLHPYEIWMSDSNWEDSRRRVLDDVYGIEVVWTSDPRDIMTGREFERAPHIEEVDVEIDLIGSFDGEYRAFSKPSFNRFWKLQRVDTGPWRISSVQGI